MNLKRQNAFNSLADPIANPITETVNLSSLHPGESGSVGEISSNHRELKFKILSLGLVKGALVRVLNIAPFGDPITIEVKGSKVCLRKSEASIVMLSDVHLAPQK